jgi:hypothetical protein
MKKTILIFLGAFLGCGGMNPKRIPKDATDLRFAKSYDCGSRIKTDLSAELILKYEHILRNVCKGRICASLSEFRIPQEYRKDVRSIFQSCALCHGVYMKTVTLDSYDVNEDKPKKVSLTDKKRLSLLKKIKKYWEHHGDAQDKIKNLLETKETEAKMPEVIFLLKRMYWEGYPQCEHCNSFYSPLSYYESPMTEVSAELLDVSFEEVMVSGPRSDEFFIDKIGKLPEGWRPDPDRPRYRLESEARDP